MVNPLGKSKRLGIHPGLTHLFIRKLYVVLSPNDIKTQPDRIPLPWPESEYLGFYPVTKGQINQKYQK